VVRITPVAVVVEHLVTVKQVQLALLLVVRPVAQPVLHLHLLPVMVGKVQ
jgi:hypothetical protein